MSRELDVFKKARQLMEESPQLYKANNSLEENESCVCSVVAIIRAINPKYAITETKNKEPFFKLFAAINKIEDGFNGYGIIALNDEPERTKEDVLEAFDKVIRSLENA